MHLNVLFHECHIAASAKLGRQIRTANAHCDTKIEKSHRSKVVEVF